MPEADQAVAEPTKEDELENAAINDLKERLQVVTNYTTELVERVSKLEQAAATPAPIPQVAPPPNTNGWLQEEVERIGKELNALKGKIKDMI